MALKPTIFKMNINVSNLDQDVYETIPLTIAQHPSETTERMVTRILAFVLNNQEFLSFTKGLSEADDPDIWAKNYSDEFLLWIDVGEPAFDRIKKASRQAKQTIVYTFNTKSGVWWKQSKKDFATINAEVFQFEFEQIQVLAALVERTMDFSMTITDNVLYIAANKGSCEINLKRLQPE
ncbi:MULTISPECIES: YaeQ family protein [Psychromonas]|uniref:YaeQ family protein n=1 Tax=Psychromonas TaxID=67572 RepID=UPI00040F6389|nr:MULTISPECIES: YaeQ family protein [Psychromonas]MBB1274788.1 YaeQ family protein [Psychromonas sp. SR45-3]